MRAEAEDGAVGRAERGRESDGERIGLLGPVTARRDGDELVPNGTRLRGLLARLALDAGRPVGVSTLVDDLWGEQPPESAANALQSLVSRLRRALGPDLVVTAAGGYQLALPPDSVDALRFDALRRAAAGQADPARAGALLREALALWRGPALADVRDLPFAGPAAARLAEARASGVEELATRAFDAGESAGVVDELTTLLADQPLRESAAVALARALAAGGRQADALAVLDRTRDTLAAELGVDPGPELVRTRMAVLHGLDAPAAAPAARPGPRRPAPALTSFVGRDADLARLRALLERSRLVTVIGPGGAGKTRFAREALTGPDAPGTPVALVELAPLTAPAQIVAALLHAVGGPELVLGVDAAPDPEARLRTALAGRELTLVLDNCEHLIDPVAALAADLLDGTDGLRVLATSREPLNVPGEVLHPLGALAEADAVSLFADRAAAVSPGFDAHAHADVVAEICRRLDGQPLPIELAAARTRTLSPAEIAHRLDDRFRLLTSGPRTALPRHQTLRAVVDWSWDLLSADERRLAARLGVFAGGVDADAIDAVCGGDRPAGVFDELASLVDKSLVTVVPDVRDAVDGPTRYTMLETIREYAHVRLEESGERDELVATHADWALRLAETAEPGLRTRDQLVHLGRIRQVEGEILRALERAVSGGDAVRAHRLLAAMSWSWLIRGELRTAQQRSELVWTLPAPPPGPAVALNRVFRALMSASQGESGPAFDDVAQVAAMLPDLPEPRHPAVALAVPVQRAFADDDESGLAELSDSAADPWLRAVTAQMLGILAENRGDVDRERALLRTAHERFAALGDRFGLGMSVFSLGELEDLAGETGAARERFTEAVALARELGNLDDLPQYLMRLASLALRSGDPDEARRLVREATEVPTVGDGTWPAAIVDMALADIERRLGNTARARELIARSTAALLAGTGPGPDQREAFLLYSRAAVDLDDGDLDAARDGLDRAAAPALASVDGPVVAMVADLSARWAVAAGRPERAAELLGVVVARRGRLHRGDPECIATHDAVVAALGADAAAAAIERGAALPADHPPGPTPPAHPG